MSNKRNDTKVEPDSPAVQHLWRGNMEEMRACLEADNKRQGLDAAAARRLASSNMMELGRLMGGQVFYLPKGRMIQAAMRELDIRQAWAAGESVAQIARRFRVTGATVYRIVKPDRDRLKKQARGSEAPSDH